MNTRQSESFLRRVSVIRSFAAVRRLTFLFLSLLFAGVMTSVTVLAESPVADAWPSSFTAIVGDLLVRIDGPKLWTLSRIEYKQTIMGVEDSAYGSVVTYPVGQHLGTAHFLDVPGKPGEV